MPKYRFTQNAFYEIDIEAETLEEACLFVLEEYGEYTLKRCGYEIASIEFREVDESEDD